MLNFPTSYRLPIWNAMLSQQELSSRPPTRPWNSLNRSPARTPSSAWAPAPPPTFIDGLAVSGRIAGTVASWNAAPPAWRAWPEGAGPERRAPMPIYVDGADEINAGLHMIKGGGGR